MHSSNFTYSERKPNPTAGDPAPILLMLHGFASYEGHLFDFVDAFDPMFHIVALRAPLRIGPGAYRWFYFERSSDGPIINTNEEKNSIDYLLSFVSSLRASHPERPLFLLGHSQGGTMSLSALIKEPKYFEAIVNINGRVSPSCDDAGLTCMSLLGKQVLYKHGMDNPIVPIHVARKSHARLTGIGAEVAYGEYDDIGHGFNHSMIAHSAQWLKFVAMRNTTQICRGKSDFPSSITI